MKVTDFMGELCRLKFENTFNPYTHQCLIHDLPDAPKIRRDALLAMLDAACSTRVDSLWIGRDLGYRGGRRTGLALTDDFHIVDHARRWGLQIKRPTKGKAVRERTAAVIWSVLTQIERPIFLWNVFPLHPHLSDEPFSNRSHNSREREVGEELLVQLILLLQPRRVVAIGNDAAKAVNRFLPAYKVAQVRHPSYGGQNQFLNEIHKLYDLPAAAKQLVLS